MPTPEPHTPAPVEPPTGRRELLTRRWAGAGLFAVFGIAILYSRHLYAPCDDAYIFFVYAKNLVEGNGLTFNGELVWGFTSAVWVVLVSGIGLLGIPIHAGAEALSLLAGLFALWATYRLGRAISLSRLHALLPPLLLAATGDFAFYMGSGLEQTLFVGLSMLATALTFGKEEVTRSRLVATAAVMAATILTRPEGVLVCALVLLIWAVRLRRVGPPFCCGLLLMLFAAPVHAALCLHFGELLPNTYYAKSNAGIGNVVHGLGYLRAALQRFLPILAVLLLMLIRRLVRGPSKPPLESRWLACIASAWVYYVVLQGGDNMVGARVLLIVAPLLYLAAAEYFRGLPHGVIAGMAVVLGALLVAAFDRDEEVNRHINSWRATYRVRRAAGIRLRDRFPPNTVVALNPAGIIPYYSGLPTIDMLGLNDRHIAKNGKRDRNLRFGHQAGDGEYVLSRTPDVILFTALSAEPGPTISDREIWASPRFHEEYAPVRWAGIGTAWVRKVRPRR